MNLKAITASLLLITMASNALADTEAQRLAKYHANRDAAYQEAVAKIKPSPVAGVPIGAMLSGGSLLYSISNSQSTSDYAIGSQLGAAASMLPHFTGTTLSSIINRR